MDQVANNNDANSSPVPPAGDNQAKSSSYDSNPFTLAFSALGRFFKHNLAWAITLIVLSFLGATIQLLGNVADLAFNRDEITSEQTNPTGSTLEDDVKFGDYTADGESLELNATPAQISVAVLFGVGILLVALVVYLISATIGVLIRGALVHVVLESEKGNSVGFSDAVQASVSKFGVHYLSSILAGLKVFAWSLLFIVPGIIAVFRYRLLSYVVMSDKDKKYGKVSAVHSRTKQLAKGRLMEIFGIGSATSLIPIVGDTLALSGYAASHNQIASYKDGGKNLPKTHWLNYVLLGLTILFFTIIAIGIGLLFLFVRSELGSLNS